MAAEPNAIERLREWVEVTGRTTVRVRKAHTWSHRADTEDALAAVDALYQAATTVTERVRQGEGAWKLGNALEALAAAVRRVEGEK